MLNEARVKKVSKESKDENVEVGGERLEWKEGVVKLVCKGRSDKAGVLRPVC